MTDTPNAVPQIRTIGEVAALNITKALELPESAVQTVEHAIADEISAMSAHFTMAVSDVQTHYEAESARLKAEYESAVEVIKSEFNYIAANPVKVGLFIGVVILIGYLIGHFA